MDEKNLLESAQKLKEVTSSSVREYADKSELLVSKMNSVMSKRRDILDLIGEKNMDMMLDNHANHARFMVSIFTSYSPEVFVETVSLGVPCLPESRLYNKLPGGTTQYMDTGYTGGS